MIIYLVLRRNQRHAHFTEVWTDSPHPGDYYVLEKDVQTMAEQLEALNMLTAKPCTGDITNGKTKKEPFRRQDPDSNENSKVIRDQSKTEDRRNSCRTGSWRRRLSGEPVFPRPRTVDATGSRHSDRNNDEQ